MIQYAVLSAIGPDRPGLVDEVSQFIFERGGNIEDSRMVNLRGQFAMMVLVSGPQDTLERINSEVWQLDQKSELHAQLRPADASRMAAMADAMAYRLATATLDQPGLVHHISHLLRTLNVNIESMETRLAAAPITGAPVFEMDLVISVPRATPVSILREKLGGLCNQLNIDWQLSAL